MTEAFPPLPAEIAAAANQVMSKIEKLDRDENNKFASYKYAGIESYLEMVRPLCAEAGLIILQDEDGYELISTADKKGDPVSWLAMSFSFGLAHKSGQTWAGRLKRTGMVQASMGSQAFGAAQSYALKSFLRSLGLIATGDTEDADSHAQSSLPDESVTTAVRGRTKWKSKSESRTSYELLQSTIREITDKAELRRHYLENRPLINSMHPDFQKFIIDEYENRQTAIDVGVDEDGKAILTEALGDEISETGGSAA